MKVSPAKNFTRHPIELGIGVEIDIYINKDEQEMGVLPY